MFLKKLNAPIENTPSEDGNTMEIAANDIKQYSPVTLAFLGDAVYSLLVRERLLSLSNRPARELHKLSLGYVSASAQASAAVKLLPLLTEEELAVYKRGRNAHSAHMPKNQTQSDYRSATGLEALFGYLKLKNDEARICTLFSEIAGEIDEK